MVMDKLCSVIVPIYNAEKTLNRCIDSILAQTYENIELILIDDGSRDRSGEIIDQYAATDRRIICIHKSNGGVSSARNAALKIATGHYVTFADADDEVRSEWLSTFLSTIDNRDLAIQGIDFVGNQIAIRSIGVSSGENNQSLISQLIEKRFLGYLVSKLFCLNIIRSNHIHFDETIRFREDDVFMLEYAQHINRWAATDKSNYIYYVPSAEKEYGSSATDCTEKVFDLLYKIFSGRIPQTILNNQAWSVKGAVVKKILSNEQISPMLLNAYRHTFSPAKGLRQRILNFLILNNESLGPIPRIILQRIN